MQMQPIILLTLITLSGLIYLQNEVYAISPVFPRQVIIDGSKDWDYSNFLASPTSNFNSSQCNQNQSFFSSTPDIEEINYLSDGKTLNATIWLSSAFEEPTDQYNFSLNETAITSTGQDLSSGPKNLVSIETKKMGNSSMNLDDYTNQRILSLRQLPSFHSENVKTTTLSGNAAHQISYTYKKINEDLQATKIWSIVGDRIYVITFLADKDRYSYYLPVVQNVIKSFSSDTTNMSSPSDGILEGYKTYVNGSLGIKVQYPPDWRPQPSGNISGRVLFYPPFREEVFKTGTTIVMAMDVNSGYDFRGEDYRVTLDWDPSIKNWTKSVQESRSSVGVDRALGSGEYIVLEKEDNYGFFFDTEKNYVKLTMDLSLINYPDQYSLVFFMTEAYTNRNSTCNIDLFDMSDEVHVPPPDFTFVVSPSSVSLRPGEEANMELKIKNSNAKLNSYVVLSTNSSGGIDVGFSPESISVPPAGLSTSLINVKANNDAEDHPYTFPIIANITFPSQLTNYLTNEKYNNTGGARIVEHSDVTVTVLPPVSLQAQFNAFITDWFNPLTATFTTVATIITGILGWSIWKRKKKKTEDK